MRSDFKQKLAPRLSAKALLLADEPLAPVTSFRIGGPAEYLLIPATVEDVQQGVSLACRHGLAWRCLGGGSNALIPDEGLPGLTIKFWHNFDAIAVKGERISAQSGAGMLSLAQAAGTAGLTGLEWACGIPGTVGGALYMNAGVKGEEIKDITVSATVLSEEGSVEQWSCEDFQFSYRTSSLQNSNAVVLDAVFQLRRGDYQAIHENMNRHLSLRSATQPIDLPNCGSVFRNPEGDFAGRLIESCGLKGYAVGGVRISEQHANFIVNTGNGTAADVLKLIAHIKQKVREQHNVEINEEVRLLK